MGIQLSDTGKSMVEKKPEGQPLIIKLLLSLWLLYKNYINYYYYNFITNTEINLLGLLNLSRYT